MEEVIIRKFSSEEKRYIKEHYTGTKDNVKAIAEKLNRSVCSIRSFAERNRLTSKVKAERWDTKENLTRREEEIYSLLLKGLSVRDISNRLYISINTVKTHYQKIFTKKGVNSIVELLAKRIEELQME